MKTSCLSFALLALPLSLADAQITVRIRSVQDNTIYANSGTLSNGAGSNMLCGTTGFQTGGVVRRALVAFDVASRIPAGAQIVSADLTLYLDRTAGLSNSVTLRRVLTDWGEAGSVAVGGLGGQGGGAAAQPGDATWTDAEFGSTTWTTAGGDFVSTVSASTTVSTIGSYNWTSATLASDVQGWVDAPSTDFGWIVRTTETGMSTAKAFGTHEHPMASRRPTLTVSYDVNASVTSVGAGCPGSGTLPLTTSTNGNPSLPSPNFTLSMSDGPTTTIGAFVIATAVAPNSFPLGNNCFAHINLGTFLATLPADQNLTAGLPIPGAGGFMGFELAVQGIVLDPTLVAAVTSNALLLTLGL